MNDQNLNPCTCQTPNCACTSAEASCCGCGERCACEAPCCTSGCQPSPEQ
ncbi:MAG: hypothetical protein U1E65_12380 [Myxococcota bacterium]